MKRHPDDDKYLDFALLSSDSVQKIGEITLQVHRVIHLKYKTEKIRNRQERNQSYADPQIQKVHESSKKSETIPHQIRLVCVFHPQGLTKIWDILHFALLYSYGPEEKVYSFGDTSYAGVKELIASFTFRYRPFGKYHAAFWLSFLQNHRQCRHSAAVWYYPSYAPPTYPNGARQLGRPALSGTRATVTI